MKSEDRKNLLNLARIAPLFGLNNFQLKPFTVERLKKRIEAVAGKLV
ncbi:MAG TPA: hypothetical protein P5337_14350 [Aestuariivirga sp.]|nr:hypothetical protein [Aestuariivirga sp.]